MLGESYSESDWAQCTEGFFDFKHPLAVAWVSLWSVLLAGGSMLGVHQPEKKKMSITAVNMYRAPVVRYHANFF